MAFLFLKLTIFQSTLNFQQFINLAIYYN